METLLVIVPRTLLALLFLSAAIDGLAYVLWRKEVFKAQLTPQGKAFLESLKANPWIWGAKATVDLIAALMLLFNFHAPLALLLLLPAIAVIILFHLSINRVGIPLAIALAVLTLALGGHYAQLYAPLLKMTDGQGPLAAGSYGHPADPAP